MTNHPTSSYQYASAIGASPIGLIVSLYDAILRDLMQGLAAVQAGQVEIRVEKLNHALAIIGHLQGVLDHDRGGEAAKHFERFYVVTRGMIVEANFRVMPEALERLIEMYGGVRQAWYQADRQLSVADPDASSANKPVDPPRTASTGVDNEGLELVQSHWSS